MEVAFRICLPRDASSVPAVRRVLGSTMRSLGVEPDCISDVEVAVTEACTNVLKHAEESQDEYEVEVELDPEEVRISVTDTGAGFDRGAITAEVEFSREGGRGIMIMQALVDAVEFKSKPKVGTIVHLAKGLKLTPRSFLRLRPASEGAPGGPGILSVDRPDVSSR